jgi:hypothetical protein
MDATMRGFLVRWLPTFLGFIAGGSLAIAVVDRVDSLGTAVVGGALAGLVLGSGQWLVLRNRLPHAGWWIAATSAGQALGLAVGSALVDYGTEPGELAVQGATTGLAVGGLQAIILRRHGAAWHWWVLAMPPLWALGWIVSWAIGVHVEDQFTNFGGACAIVVTALSGLLLWQVLRGAPDRGALVPLSTPDPS